MITPPRGLPRHLASPRMRAHIACLTMTVLGAAAGPRTALAGAPCPAGTTRKTVSQGGLVAEACFDAEGRLHGEATTRLPGGELVNNDHWDHGVRVGVWTEFYPNGTRKSETRFVAGRREGDYAEWSTRGQPLVRGTFQADKEVGPWLFAREGDPSELSVVVFDRGADITDKVLERGPGDCRSYSALSSDARRGFLTSVALLSVLRLPEKNKARIADWWLMGLCLREGSGAAAGEADAACTRGADLATEGPAAASRLAARCVGVIGGRKR